MSKSFSSLHFRLCVVGLIHWNAWPFVIKLADLCSCSAGLRKQQGRDGKGHQYLLANTKIKRTSILDVQSPLTVFLRASKHQNRQCIHEVVAEHMTNHDKQPHEWQVNVNMSVICWWTSALPPVLAVKRYGWSSTRWRHRNTELG